MQLLPNGELHPKFSLSTYIAPLYYEHVVVAVKKLSLESLHLATNLGHFIKLIAMLKISLAFKMEDREQLKDAQGFDKMFNTKWTKGVAKETILLKMQIRQEKQIAPKKLTKPIEVPLTHDIKKLMEFLNERINIELSRTPVDIKKLTRFCLASLIIFNKRRPEEVAELKVGDTSCESFAEDSEQVYRLLLPSEQLLAIR